MTHPRNNQAGPHRPAGAIPADAFRVDEIRPIGEAMQVLRWGPRSLALAKRKGLRVLTFGKRSYIYGGDLLDFLTAQPTVERHGGPGRPDLIAGRAAGEGQQP